VNNLEMAKSYERQARAGCATPAKLSKAETTPMS